MKTQKILVKIIIQILVLSISTLSWTYASASALDDLRFAKVDPNAAFDGTASAKKESFKASLNNMKNTATREDSDVLKSTKEQAGQLWGFIKPYAGIGIIGGALGVLAMGTLGGFIGGAILAMTAVWVAKTVATAVTQNKGPGPNKYYPI